MNPRLGRGLLIVPFIALATLNSGGYRYGASDQAFYLPAVLAEIDPSLFPRDTALLEAQTRLTGADEAVALLARLTATPLPALFAVLYLVAVTLIAAGGWQVARRLYRTTWAAVALLAALTLRHAIARSGTNTLEGYFHPRTVVYGLGILAIAAFLRGRVAAVAGLLLLGAIVHPPTALWFTLWLGVAIAVADRRHRKWMLIAAVSGTIAGAWALLAGPLAGRLTIMDAEWRRLLASKDYLFPLEWPAYAWILNLGYLPVIAWVYSRRSRRGLVDDRERALVLGSTTLLAIFAGALVCHVIGIALAIQLQPARVFWMFDFMAVVYGVWLLAEGEILGTSGEAARQHGNFRLKAEATNTRGDTHGDHEDFRLKAEATNTRGDTHGDHEDSRLKAEATNTRGDIHGDHEDFRLKAEGANAREETREATNTQGKRVASAFRRKSRSAAFTALLITCFSVARGLYVIWQAERPPVQLTIPNDDWGRAMAWARSTEKSTNWLAHPLHAIRYGTSVRVAGERDVVVEVVKDSALGMYDRRVAVRTEERVQAIGPFEALSGARARELAAIYDVNYLVTEQPMPLPLAFQSGAIRVYRLQ